MKMIVLNDELELVEGYLMTSIIDLRNGRICILNNRILELLKERNSVEFISKKLNVDYDELNIYFLNLIQEGFLLNGTFEDSCVDVIPTNSNLSVDLSLILELSDFSNVISVSNLAGQIRNLGVALIQYRIFNNVNVNFIYAVLNSLKNSSVLYIEFYINVTELLDSVNFIRKLIAFKRVIRIHIFGSIDDKIYDFSEKVVVTKGALITNANCGMICSSRFVISNTNYFLNKKLNSCLHSKLAIDTEGEIKNCPSMKESFGNIKDTTLVEAIEKPDFKKYWNINKDKIHVCKDCEFRYICTDCRAYVEDPEDILSKPLKCGYNPYTGEWSEWSDNPLKQKAIDFYGMREMVDNSKI